MFLSGSDDGYRDALPGIRRKTLSYGMTMRQGIPPEVAERNGAPQGWRETFDKLDAYLFELRRRGETLH